MTDQDWDSDTLDGYVITAEPSPSPPIPLRPNTFFELDGITYNRFDGTNVYHNMRPMFQLIPDHESQDVFYDEIRCGYCENGPPYRGSTHRHIMEEREPFE